MLLKNKKQLFNFKSDFGIGSSRFIFILLKLGLNLFYCFKKFYKYPINIIKRYKLILFYKKWLITNKLKTYLRYIFKSYKIINNYKYIRLKFGLPVNGQRTHTNRQNSIKYLMNFRLLNTQSKINRKFKARKKK